MLGKSCLHTANVRLGRQKIYYAPFFQFYYHAHNQYPFINPYVYAFPRYED